MQPSYSDRFQGPLPAVNWPFGWDAGIRERRIELERRGIEWRKREAEQDLAALEEKAEATPAQAGAS